MLISEARYHAEEAARMIKRGCDIVKNGAGPGEPTREATRKALCERAISHALTAIALALTEK